MTSAKKVKFDTLRSIAFGDTSGTYAPIGTILTVNPRLWRIINNTDGDMIVSDDNTIADGKMFIPSNSFVLYDFEANLNVVKDDNFEVSIGTIVYIKQSGTAPTKGSVYLEIVYG